MNAYMNFINDATLYAILQALTSLNQDIKEEIIFRIVLYIIDENLPIPDDMWNNMSDDDNEWWIN